MRGVPDLLTFVETTVFKNEAAKLTAEQKRQLRLIATQIRDQP